MTFSNNSSYNYPKYAEIKHADKHHCGPSDIHTAVCVSALAVQIRGQV